jgi:hypothetical protein
MDQLGRRDFRADQGKKVEPSGLGDTFLTQRCAERPSHNGKELSSGGTRLLPLLLKRNFVLISF